MIRVAVTLHVLPALVAESPHPCGIREDGAYDYLFFFLLSLSWRGSHRLTLHACVSSLEKWAGNTLASNDKRHDDG